MNRLFTTVVFDDHKANGWIAKAGKASFFDGMRRYERALWRDDWNGRFYVKLNGEAYEFTPFTVQSEADVIIGQIY